MPKSVCFLLFITRLLTLKRVFVIYLHLRTSTNKIRGGTEMKKLELKRNFRRRVSWFLLGVATATTINTFTAPAQPEQVNAEAIQEATIEVAYITEHAPTVWDLAKAEFPGENTAAIIHEISQLNPEQNLDQVKKGQAITIPTR